MICVFGIILHFWWNVSTFTKIDTFALFFHIKILGITLRSCQTFQIWSVVCVVKRKLKKQCYFYIKREIKTGVLFSLHPSVERCNVWAAPDWVLVFVGVRTGSPRRRSLGLSPSAARSLLTESQMRSAVVRSAIFIDVLLRLRRTLVRKAPINEVELDHEQTPL